MSGEGLMNFGLRCFLKRLKGMNGNIILELYGMFGLMLWCKRIGDWQKMF